MPWFCSQSKRGSEERFRTSLYCSLHYRQKYVVPSSASSSSSLPQPAPPAPVGSSGSKINPVVLFIIVILAVIFFVSGLLHLLIRFLMKQKQHASASSPQSNTGYQRDISGSEALQRQLQQLFHLHDSGLDQSFIDALPIFLYKEIVGTKEQFDCAVCLCEFDDEDKLRLLPMCSHAFHLSCIDTWLLSNSTCPLCRGNLFIPGLAIENPVFDFNDDDGNLEDGSSLSLPALNQKAGDLDDEEEGSGCVVGKKKVFPVRLGKFKSVQSSNNPGRLVINNNDNSNMRREEGESSSSNLDARRCFSMGSYQYVVGDSVLPWADATAVVDFRFIPRHHTSRQHRDRDSRYSFIQTDRERERGERGMGNSLRCCLSCVLPCGALDLIRIVHSSGHVDQYSHSVPASEILSANPNHVLTKPCSDATATSRRRIIIISPDSDLKRGSIYFLVPSSSLPQNLMKKQKKTERNGNGTPSDEDDACCRKRGIRRTTAPTAKKHMQRHRRSGRVSAWRQQLESIAED